MPHVLIGISSGIAAFKMVEVIELLKKENLEVEVMLTKSAQQMVDISALQKASGNPVWNELYPANFNYQQVLKSRQVEHIQVADRANLLVIAPATANTIAKLAHGLADDFLTTTTLAVTCPVVIFPSMNVHMWHHPSVQQNLQKLKSYGYIVVDPDSGPLACGYEGKGRLPDVKAMVAEIQKLLHTSQMLTGKKVLVTLGGTQEKIDAVRSITNRSSGKMGAAIADACVQAGAMVTVLRAGSAVQPRFTTDQKTFTSAQELEELVRKESITADIIFHVAAVADFSIKSAMQNHHQKITSDQPLTLQLEPRPKILDAIKKWNPKTYLIAFKAEVSLTENELVTKARQRLQSSPVDVIIANDVGQTDRGFQAEDNEVLIVQKNLPPHKITLAPKPEVARKIVEYLFAKS